MINLQTLKTEQRNQKTLNLNHMTTLEFLNVMNQEDANAIGAVHQELHVISKIVELVASKIKMGGRLIYIGAGTSGRMGILDAVECIPTFSTSDEVIALIAGGENAFISAVEGAEDSSEYARNDLVDLNVNSKDVIMGIAASGRTPYVIGGLEYANEVGADTIAFACNKNAEISKYAKIALEVDTGAEVITGSTRLKAGTATKVVLNMISTATMVKLGKTYSNLMVDVKPTNEKLIERTKKIVMEAVDCDYETAQNALAQCDYRPKVAIIMILLQCTAQTAIEKLANENDLINII